MIARPTTMGAEMMTFFQCMRNVAERSPITIHPGPVRLFASLGLCAALTACDASPGGGVPEGLLTGLAPRDGTKKERLEGDWRNLRKINEEFARRRRVLEDQDELEDTRDSGDDY